MIYMIIILSHRSIFGQEVWDTGTFLLSHFIGELFLTLQAV